MSDRISIQGVAIATSAVVASTGLTVAAHAVAAEPEPRPAAVTRTGPLPAEASVRRSMVPAGERLAEVKAKNRRHARHARHARQAVRAAIAAREARADDRASRSTRTVSRSGARGIAASMAASRYGWGADQFSCLDSLWGAESGWNVHASNPSGAYGIPQALPGSKMSTYGGDWRDSATTQIQWGLSYIDGRYGSPCSALGAFRSTGWY